MQYIVTILFKREINTLNLCKSDINYKLISVVMISIEEVICIDKSILINI